MKKIKITDMALIFGVVLIIVLGCFVMKGTKAEPTYELPLVLSGDAGLSKLSYSEYMEKINNDDAFVVIISRATCSHCVTFKPIAEGFASDNNLPMYYVDTDDFTEEEWGSFEKSNTFFKKNSGNWGTPTTLVLAGSECVDSIEGVTDEESLMDLYNKYFDLDDKDGSEE